MNALVTGSNGFIGSHLVEALLAVGYEVNCLVRKSSNLRWIKNLPVNMITGDCVDKESLYPAVKGMDYVFHVGGVIKGRSREHFYSVNCNGTKNLAEVCSELGGLKKFVLVSSMSAAGPGKPGAPVTEARKPEPISDYGRSKLAAEEVIKEFKDIPWVIIRPCNILGTREDDFINVLKLIKKRIIPVMGNGDRQTSLCFIKDLVAGLILAAEKKESTGKVYFISDGEYYSWRYLIGLARKLMKVKAPVIKLAYPLMYTAGFFMEVLSKITGSQALLSRGTVKEGRDVYWIYDISKIRKELGYLPEVDFEQGLKDTIRLSGL